MQDPITVPAPQMRSVGIQFHGKTSEYFSLWIVNILLTILTLGIYSAWATVRTNRYFYSNTEIDGHRFSYLATPLQILKGRLIAVALFAIYALTASMSPAISAIFALVIFLLTPLLICLSLRFQLRMTAYRNVSFDFSGSYGRAFLMFVVLPIASLFTLYLMLPWVLKKIDEFIYEHASFGDRKVRPSLSTGEYYMAAIGAFFIGLFLLAVMFGIFGGVFGITSESLADPAIFSGMIGFLFFAAYVFILILTSSFYHAYIRNHIFNHTDIENVCEFESNLGFWELSLLRITNFAAIVLTLGFATPWVKIRTARLYAKATNVTVKEGAENVLGRTSQSDSTGDEVADVFDINIGIA